MDKNKTMAMVLGILGTLATVALLLLRRKEGIGASLSVKILDSLGNEVPHNSAVELQPGDYKIEATVTNLSRSQGEPVGATLTTHIEYSWAGYSMGSFNTTGAYDAEETKIHRFSLYIPLGWVGYPGTINASVLDPNNNKLAEAELAFNVV